MAATDLGGTGAQFIWQLHGRRLREPRKFAQFAIVGRYADDRPGFVRHVALLATESELSASATVRVWHMGPPIAAGSGSGRDSPGTGECRADLVIELPLSADDRNAMSHWRAKVETERRPAAHFRQYRVCPSVSWERSELGRKIYRRFSCAGFVTSCYEAAGILILGAEPGMPDAALSDINAAYPEIARVAAMGAALKARLGFTGFDDLGIPGSGPWKAVLAGYIFNSCHRSTGAAPTSAPHYPASVNEAYYPQLR